MDEEESDKDIELRNDVVESVKTNLDNRIEQLRKGTKQDRAIVGEEPNKERINEMVVNTIVSSDGELNLIGFSGKGNDTEQSEIAEVVVSRLRELSPQALERWAEREKDGNPFTIQQNQEILIKKVNADRNKVGRSA